MMRRTDRIPLQPLGTVVRCMSVESDAAVYIKYRDDLLRYATSLVGPDQAEDVVSTVVLRAIRGQGLAELDRPHAYLMKGVLNESRSVWRRVSTVPALVSCSLRSVEHGRRWGRWKSP